jgi:hypothetical protein
MNLGRVRIFEHRIGRPVALTLSAVAISVMADEPRFSYGPDWSSLPGSLFPSDTISKRERELYFEIPNCIASELTVLQTIEETMKSLDWAAPS